MIAVLFLLFLTSCVGDNVQSKIIPRLMCISDDGIHYEECKRSYDDYKKDSLK